MLDPKHSNLKVLKNHLKKVRLLIEESQPILLQKTQLGREFVLEMDRIVMDFCKNPPQNIEELESFIVNVMLKMDAKSEVWKEMIAFFSRVIVSVRNSNRKFSKEDIANALYFCRNTIALLIGISVRPPAFYEGDAAASKN